MASGIRHTRVRSGIRLDSNGQFWHDGQKVTHPGILRAWHRGLERAPDGRYLIRFGHDWAFVRVDDAPFFVLRAFPEEKGVRLRLSNGVEEFLQPQTLGLSKDGVLYCKVMGDHVAKFSRQAQADIGALLRQDGERFLLLLDDSTWPIEEFVLVPPPRPEEGPAPVDNGPYALHG